MRFTGTFGCLVFIIFEIVQCNGDRHRYPRSRLEYRKRRPRLQPERTLPLIGGQLQMNALGPQLLIRPPILPTRGRAICVSYQCCQPCHLNHDHHRPHDDDDDASDSYEHQPDDSWRPHRPRRPTPRPDYRPDRPDHRPDRPNYKPDYRPDKPDYRPDIIDYKPDRPDYVPDKPDIIDYKPDRPDHRPDRPDYRPDVIDYKPDRPDYRPDRPNYRPDIIDYKPDRPDYKPKRPDPWSFPTHKPPPIDIDSDDRPFPSSDESPDPTLGPWVPEKPTMEPWLDNPVKPTRDNWGTLNPEYLFTKPEKDLTTVKPYSLPTISDYNDHVPDPWSTSRPDMTTDIWLTSPSHSDSTPELQPVPHKYPDRDRPETTSDTWSEPWPETTTDSYPVKRFPTPRWPDPTKTPLGKKRPSKGINLDIGSNHGQIQIGNPNKFVRHGLRSRLCVLSEIEEYCVFPK